MLLYSLEKYVTVIKRRFPYEDGNVVDRVLAVLEAAPEMRVVIDPNEEAVKRYTVTDSSGAGYYMLSFYYSIVRRPTGSNAFDVHADRSGLEHHRLKFRRRHRP